MTHKLAYIDTESDKPEDQPVKEAKEEIEGEEEMEDVNQETKTSEVDKKSRSDSQVARNDEISRVR